MEKKRHILPLVALFVLMSTGMSGCGGTYVPRNIALGCYAKDTNGKAIPGLQASLIRRATNETVRATITDSIGYADFVVVHDEVTTGINASEAYKDYKITLVDPNGIYATTEFQPRLASSDADITVIVPKK